MNRMTFALALFAVVVGPAPSRAAEERKPVVAVFEIQAQNLVLKPGVLAALAGYVASKLAETGRYEVVPQDKLKDALSENKKKTYKDCYSQSCQIAIGQEVAANKALSTKVLKLGTRCTVTSDLFDLRKATSGISATAKGECSEDGIQSSIDEVVAKLARTGGTAHAKPETPAKPDGKPDPSPAPVKPDPPPPRPVAMPDPMPVKAPAGVVRDGNRLRLASQIHFEFHKATIRRESFPVLDELARTIAANPQLRRLRVDGHTDSRGKAGHLLKLSQARADAIRAHLIQRGVAPGRLEAVGHGMTRPVDSNKTEMGRARNRRVEIIVVEEGADPAPALPIDARSQFLRGQKLYTEGRYADALLAFRAAHTLEPRPALEYNIALCHERLGQLAEAIAAYRRFVAKSPPGAAASMAAERVRQLEARQR